MGRSQAAVQRLPAGSSSGARSLFFSVHPFVRSAASLFQSLYPAHQGVRGSSLFAAFRNVSPRRWPSRFRIVGTPAHLAPPVGHGAAQAREPGRAGNAQLQHPAALAQTSAVPNSCEPPQGLQSSRSSGAVSIRIHIRNATASLTPACSGLATLAADSRRQAAAPGALVTLQQARFRMDPLSFHDFHLGAIRSLTSALASSSISSTTIPTRTRTNLASPSPT